MAETDDERVALAVAALSEVTDPADVGPLVEVVQPEPGVVDLRFACASAGYPDWRWTVSTSVVDGIAPTVLEIGLLPGEGALLAPPWVPWAERLAEWRRTHADQGLDEPEDVLEDEDEDEDDVLDPDDEVDEELGDDADLDEDLPDDGSDGLAAQAPTGRAEGVGR